MRTISVTVMVITSEVPFWRLLGFSYVQSSFSIITRHIENGIWKILYSWRSKILQTWINILANYFIKYHEIKMGEDTLGIISCTKMQASSLMNIVQGHFTYYCIFLCLSNKPSFQIQPSLDWINFHHNLLSFTFEYYVYLGVRPVSLHFFKKASKVLKRLKLLFCLFVFLKVYSCKTFFLFFPWNIRSANDKNYSWY